MDNNGNYSSCIDFDQFLDSHNMNGKNSEDGFQIVNLPDNISRITMNEDIPIDNANISREYADIVHNKSELDATHDDISRDYNISLADCSPENKTATNGIHNDCIVSKCNRQGNVSAGQITNLIATDNQSSETVPKTISQKVSESHTETIILDCYDQSTESVVNATSEKISGSHTVPKGYYQSRETVPDTSSQRVSVSYGGRIDIDTPTMYDQYNETVIHCSQRVSESHTDTISSTWSRKMRSQRVSESNTDTISSTWSRMGNLLRHNASIRKALARPREVSISEPLPSINNDRDWCPSHIKVCCNNTLLFQLLVTSIMVNI